MATISDLNVRLGLLYKDFDSNLKKVERNLERSGRKFSQLGNDLALSISLPLAALGAAAIKQAGEIESLKLAMISTFEGAGRSAADATKEVELLRQAAKAPGLDFEQAIRGSVRLQNVGFSAEDTRETLVQLANAIALTGGTAQELDGVTRQFAQIVSKGRILQEDITILSENMPKISSLMKDAFGTANVERLREMGITGQQFVKGITEAAATLPRVEGGIKNALVNAASEARNSLATLGETIVKTFDVKGKLDAATSALQTAVQWFSNLSDGTKSAIIQFGLFAVVIGPAIKVMGALYGGAAQVVGMFGTLISSTKSLALVFGGMTQSTQGLGGYFKSLGDTMYGVGGAAVKMRVALLAATAGVAAIVLGIAAAVYLLSDNFNAAEFAAKTFADATTQVREESAKEIGVLNKNIDVLRAATASTDDRKKAADELLKAYPDYLKGIDLEKASLGDLKRIQDELTGSIIRNIAERKKATAVNTLYEKQADILLRIQEIQRTGKVTTGESALVDTGDVIAAGYSIAGAVVVKLQQQVEDLGKQATVTAGDYDKAFGLQTSALNLQQQAQYDARQAAEDLRSEYSAAGSTVNQNTAATTTNTNAVNAGVAATKNKTAALKDEWEELDKIIDQLEAANEQEAKATIGEIKRANPNFAPLPTANVAGTANFSNDAANAAIDALINKVKTTKPVFTEMGRQWSDTIGEMMAKNNNFGYQALDSANQIAAGIVQIQKNRSAQEKAELDAEYANKIAAAQGNAAMIESLNAELAAKKAAIDKKVARNEQRIAIVRAVIDTALAVSKALGSAPPPFNFVLAGLSAAAGAVQIGTIKSQKFAKGGVITSPTFGLMGEYPGARNNPEIVTPERLMRSVFREESGAGGRIEVFGSLSAEGIHIANIMGERRRGRIR